jgi:hypothetical protein
MHAAFPIDAILPVIAKGGGNGRNMTILTILRCLAGSVAVSL